jgi:hypothetical protein
MCGDYEIEETGLLMEERAAFLVLAANSHHAMKEALEEIARQKTMAELERNEVDLDGCDLEGGYDAIIELARAVLTKEI